MADPMENENLENQNIKHTEGAEMPDTTVAGQVYSRLRADLPAFVAFVSSRAVLLPVLLGGAAAGVGYFAYRRAKQSSPAHKIKSFLRAT
ncbi:MAG: hypothetical protein A2Z97_06465 [Bdellovibrionales bacterium GWB1_52_6]|nr:MAG: hypothetical protein A2Z97_06465 [Bdellovibrionales bacterium GWB1_52_6]OFZ05528.1 MAG: hypothetical protein A2X97_11695 [Bdellovibrionales bacterium GWA1_52_35]HCM39103.1 hypothetical protein [Bdellovibrionales bacterium]